MINEVGELEMNLELPTGNNLKAMRKAAGKSIKETVVAANAMALALKSDITFSQRAIRRFENIGVNEKTYGKTPPTYAQISILLRVYNGTPGYLLLNMTPITYPLEHYDKLQGSFFTPQMTQLMSDIGSWPLSRQHLFFEFYKSFIRK